MHINIIEAQPKLHDLINQVSSSHKPVTIKGSKSSAVLGYSKKLIIPAQP